MHMMYGNYYYLSKFFANGPNKLAMHLTRRHYLRGSKIGVMPSALMRVQQRLSRCIIVPYRIFATLYFTVALPSVLSCCRFILVEVWSFRDDGDIMESLDSTPGASVNQFFCPSILVGCWSVATVVRLSINTLINPRYRHVLLSSQECSEFQ